jgi:GNAT superfamily N-acetyltransferase
MLWWTGPSDQPSDINSRLADHGFRILEAPGMAADLNSLAEKWDSPEKLAIKRVENNEELQIWCRTLCAVIGVPDFATHAFFDFFTSLGFDPAYPYHNYLGSLEGEAVATSSLLLCDGVAGIYNVATRKEARRKGIGTAMTAAPLGEARSLGYRVGILHSAGTGYNVYRSLGFQEYCKFFVCSWHVSEKT